MKKLTKLQTEKHQQNLLDWFDANQRAMPWRARKGQRSNPYHVWLSEIMLQQTTVVAVIPYFLKFIQKWPTIEKLAAADLDDVLAAWAGLGYYARARNLHKCAKAVAKLGFFPKTEERLMELPGVGPYTAAAIASIAFNQPAVAVDGNVERVVSRFFAILEPLPKSKPDMRKGAAILAEANTRPGDFTQAMMELGATVCTPKSPKCGLCPLAKACLARKQGIAAELPRKQKKKAKPVRYGHVYFVTDGKGRFVIEKRQGSGLYQGMYQLPTTAWTEKMPKTILKGMKSAEKAGVEVRHSFTHFDLVLEIWKVKAKPKPAETWIAFTDMERYALPSLMQKAIKLMRAS